MARTKERIDDILSPANYDPKSTYSKPDFTPERLISVTSGKTRATLGGIKNEASFHAATPPLHQSTLNNELDKSGTKNKHTPQEPAGGPFGGPLKP